MSLENRRYVEEVSILALVSRSVHVLPISWGKEKDTRITLFPWVPDQELKSHFTDYSGIRGIKSARIVPPCLSVTYEPAPVGMQQQEHSNSKNNWDASALLEPCISQSCKWFSCWPAFSLVALLWNLSRMKENRPSFKRWHRLALKAILKVVYNSFRITAIKS